MPANATLADVQLTCGEGYFALCADIEVDLSAQFAVSSLSSSVSSLSSSVSPSLSSSASSLSSSLSSSASSLSSTAFDDDTVQFAPTLTALTRATRPQVEDDVSTRLQEEDDVSTREDDVSQVGDDVSTREDDVSSAKFSAAAIHLGHVEWEELLSARRVRLND